MSAPLKKHACTYIWTNIAGSAAVEESSMLAAGAAWRRLQHPGCGRSVRSHCEEIHGVSILIPLEADISSGRQHHQISCLHHYGVEGTTACQGSSWIHSIQCHINNTGYVCSPDEEEHGTAHTGSDEEGHGRAYTGLIKASRELSFPIDYKSWSSYSSVARVITTTSSKYLPKYLSSRLQLN